MHVFVYELITGGGLLAESRDDLRSLATEGAAMATAVAGDFAALSEVDVVVLRDHRFQTLHFPGCQVVDVATVAEERRQFKQYAGRCDWTLVIAPESGNLLLDRCRRVSLAGGRLLGPSLQLVALCADKHVCAEHLRAAGIRVPQGVALAAGEPLPTDFCYPAVLKPRDGAGSRDVRLIEHPPASDNFADTSRTAHVPSRLEQYRAGLAVSVAALVGPRQQLVLPPARQHLSRDGRFTYQGGALPLESRLAARAMRLMRQTLGALPASLGYLGADLVLGSDPNGDDVVIEVNPRLTTSYVGLRAISQDNLAGAMLAVAGGEKFELSFSNAPLRFKPDGRLDPAGHAD